MWLKNSDWLDTPATRVQPLYGVTRRSALRLAITGVTAFSAPWLVHARNSFDHITVWKTPSCGCCKAWVSHLQKNGFDVVVNDVKDTAAVRLKLGMPENMGSCHTATVGDYVLEGHVPAREVHQLLREKPTALGLAVPGMPMGSPGMEMGRVRDAYNVMLVRADGSSRIYKSYPAMGASKPPLNPKETS